MMNYQKGLYYLSNKYYNVIITKKGVNNMTNFLNVQFSVFGEFSDIEATSENILKIMNELEDKDFLPSTVTNQNIDMNTKKIETESRISFVTKDQQCNFVIFNERIDFNYNFNNVASEKSDEFFNQLKDDSSKVLIMLMDLFAVKGNRVAININVIGTEPVNDNTNHHYHKNIKGLDYYTDKEINDWSNRVNARVDVNISNKTEILNVITNLSIATNIDSKEKRLICHFDINTIGENTIERFGAEELDSFMQETNPIVIQLIDNFKEVEKNE